MVVLMSITQFIRIPSIPDTFIAFSTPHSLDISSKSRYYVSGMNSREIAILRNSSNRLSP